MAALLISNILKIYSISKKKCSARTIEWSTTNVLKKWFVPCSHHKVGVLCCFFAERCICGIFLHQKKYTCHQCCGANRAHRKQWFSLCPCRDRWRKKACLCEQGFTAWPSEWWWIVTSSFKDLEYRLCSYIWRAGMWPFTKNSEDRPPQKVS